MEVHGKHRNKPRGPQQNTTGPEGDRQTTGNEADDGQTRVRQL